MEQDTFTIQLTHQERYAFTADYGPELPPLLVDELPPLGDGRGPNPSRLLATAVGHCLAASLLFCLRKQRIEPTALTVRVEGRLARNERGRLRIGGIRVTLSPSVTDADRQRMGRCTGLFEDFCVVTASVRQAFPVDVTVEPAPGAEVTCPSCRPDADSWPRPVPG